MNDGYENIENKHALQSASDVQANALGSRAEIGGTAQNLVDGSLELYDSLDEKRADFGKATGNSLKKTALFGGIGSAGAILISNLDFNWFSPGLNGVLESSTKLLTAVLIIAAAVCAIQTGINYYKERKRRQMIDHRLDNNKALSDYITNEEFKQKKKKARIALKADAQAEDVVAGARVQEANVALTNAVKRVVEAKTGLSNASNQYSASAGGRPLNSLESLNAATNYMLGSDCFY